VCFPLELAGASKAEAEKRAMELLELVGLPDKAKSFPAQLSGGQQQRVAIARALATDPKVLLCDEATSALDPKTTRQILDLIKEINKKLGITCVIITHQMSVVEECCNKVAILDNGVIVEKGDVATVFGAPTSEAGRRLVFPGRGDQVAFDSNAIRQIRLIFNGTDTTSQPLIANMAVEMGILATILTADTRVIHDNIVGTMLIGVPNNKFDQALAYIRSVGGIEAEEVNSHV
ncbi:MAG: ATP-binding cassette domain-containing protein, partial [Firmicutes bacterium]|nr:ATP-binding cassette domain-containing protein [Bacillota bacterium]